LRRGARSLAGLGLLLVSCGGDPPASGSSGDVGARSAGPARSVKEPSPPSSADPFADPVPPAPTGPGPAPSSAAEGMRERAVLDLLEGKTRAEEIPEVATEEGETLDPLLREQLAPRVNGPKLKALEAKVGEGLAAPVVQRIVRQSFGAFRLCYERGLQMNPNLIGKVTVKFAIGPKGTVPAVASGGDLPDAVVVACVGKAFRGLTFPEPDGGRTVPVEMGIFFAPGG
jgi:hypothetical protein